MAITQEHIEELETLTNEAFDLLGIALKTNSKDDYIAPGKKYFELFSKLGPLARTIHPAKDMMLFTREEAGPLDRYFLHGYLAFAAVESLPSATITKPPQVCEEWTPVTKVIMHKDSSRPYETLYQGAFILGEKGYATLIETSLALINMQVPKPELNK